MASVKRNKSVSIHAPARGATPCIGTSHPRQTVSIHAPARGATGKNPTRFRTFRFNPRPRAGGDALVVVNKETTHKFQSTPPRGGRRRSEQRRSPIQVSIHAPARGATPQTATNPLCRKKFQSTPPRGGRRKENSFRKRCPACFNPRPRAGGDMAEAIALAKANVSIHAPARGATICIFVRAKQNEFQSTPPRGGRHGDTLKPHVRIYGFNPRPRAGGDGFSLLFGAV